MSAKVSVPREPTAYLHEIKEPDRDWHHMLSRSSESPWSHWLESHLNQCETRCTPLYREIDGVTAAPPPPMEDVAGLVAKLREDAVAESEAHKFLADAKTQRNHEAEGIPPGEPGYDWLKPEQTTRWKAADALERLSAQSGAGEVARLRKALEWIASRERHAELDAATEDGKSNFDRGMAPYELLQGMANYARAALADTQGET